MLQPTKPQPLQRSSHFLSQWGARSDCWQLPWHPHLCNGQTRCCPEYWYGLNRRFVTLYHSRLLCVPKLMKHDIDTLHELCKSDPASLGVMAFDGPECPQMDPMDSGNGYTLSLQISSVLCIDTQPWISSLGAFSMGSLNESIVLLCSSVW